MDFKLPELWVSACWDEENQLYFAESNIPGLNIEADSLGEFEDVMFDVAPELILENILKPILAEHGVTDVELVASEVKEVKKPASKKSSAVLPETVPFIFRGAAPRPMNFAMA